MLLQGKTILITGASRGIGKAIAELFAQEGAHLILTARSLETLVELKKSLPNPDSHRCFSMDVSKESEIIDVFQQLQQEKIQLFGLVNNAGVMIDSTLQMYKTQDMLDLYQVNVFGSILVAKYAIKFLVKNRGGSIINLSSIIGTNGNHGQSVYGSSKSAIIGFTKSLSKELAPLNIRVNAIAPGFIDTEMTKGMDPKFYERNLGLIGMRRIGNPLDVAKTALFLASDLSSYVTGQTIGVDGGMVI